MRVLNRLCVAVLLVAASLGPFVPAVEADGVPPITLQIREQEAGRYLAEWRVPKQFPPRAIPSPVLPESCRAIGERGLTDRPGAWFVRQAYDCPEGLAGHSVGIEFPVLNATVSTILQIELLSGDRYAHSFVPGEGAWRVPDATAGDARAFYRMAGEAVSAGVDHLVRNGVHWALVLVLIALGGSGVARLVGFFSAAQLAALGVTSLSGFQLGAAFAEVGLAAGVVLLAREALRPSAERRQLGALMACAGLVHGLGLAGLVALPADYDGSVALYLAIAVIGMDAGLLVVGGLGVGLRKLMPVVEPRWIAYAAGVAAVALALGLPASDVAAESLEKNKSLQLPDLPIPEGATATPASRRVATQFPDAKVQSFLTVSPFEVRHEVLIDLAEFAETLGLEPGGEVAIEEQELVKAAVRELPAARSDLTIDGETREPAISRVDFLTLSDQGALPRPTPVAEAVDEAWIGLTTVYLSDQTPQELMLTWEVDDAQTEIPATITDPESTRSVQLSVRRPTLHWKNELSEDPAPVVTALAVEPPVAWMPLLSLAVLVGMLLLIVIASRRSRRDLMGPVARVGLAVALLLAPVGAVAVPLPRALDSTPDEVEAERILARVLPNVYRAFEFPTESAAYDRLALSVVGDTLADIYLEHRRAVQMEERGGARARVEAVEVLDVATVEPAEPDGFTADAVWTVGGTVTHFGHRHFRQNRYDARVTMAPIDGTWKIESIDVLDEERLQ